MWNKQPINRIAAQLKLSRDWAIYFVLFSYKKSGGEMYLKNKMGETGSRML